MRRELTKEDMIRMHIPNRYWDVSFGGVDNSKRMLDKVLWYGKNLEDMIKKGVGLLFWGDNSIGKTGLAVCFAKEFRRRCKSVLFFDASDFKRAVFQKEYFDDEKTVWIRATSVDMLVFDDLGKDIEDDKNSGVNLVDKLLRLRNSKKLITFVTTNMNHNQLKDMLLDTTIKTMSECIVPIFCEGSDRRKDAFQEIKEYIDD